MKSFNEFLTESRKQYQFRIKIAGTVDDKQLDKIEAALDTWSLVSLSSPKTTPIQKNPSDFPLLKEIEVSMMDVILDYPVTTHELHIKLHQCSGIAQNYIRVCSEHETSDMEIEGGEESPILTSPYPKSEEKKNPHYGDKFIKEFLKQESNIPYKYKIAGGKTRKGVTTNDLPQGNNSIFQASNVK